MSSIYNKSLGSSQYLTELPHSWYIANVADGAIDGLRMKRIHLFRKPETVPLWANGNYTDN